MLDDNWVRQKEKPAYMLGQGNGRKVKIVDLFSGAGGMTLGTLEALYSHGFEARVALAVDNNKVASEIYTKNFKPLIDNFIDADISSVLNNSLGGAASKKELELLELVGDVDILLAGPPCQGNSNLNNHSRRTDPKNELYLHAVRFIELFSPTIAIIENVPSVVHSSQGVLNSASEAISSDEYKVEEHILNLADMGLPQTRKRHILVAVKKTFPAFRYKPVKTEHKAIGEFIDDLLEVKKASKGIYDKASNMSEVNQERVNYLFENDIFDLPNHLRPDCHRLKPHSYKSMYGRMYWDKPCQTITGGFGSMGQGRFIHPKMKRVLTPHEASRLQGIPDFIEFDMVDRRTDLHQVIGNIAPPLLSANIINELLKQASLKEGSDVFQYSKQGKSDIESILNSA